MQLIAGDVNLVDNEEQWWQMLAAATRNTNQRSAWEPRARAGSGSGTTTSIRSSQLTTVANNQDKQISFLDADEREGYARVMN